MKKKWKWIKSYKWTENSKSKLIDSLLSENIKNNIIEFEMENFKENQIGVDGAAQKLVDIFDSISSLSCKVLPKNRKKKTKKFKQKWSDNVVYETKHQLNRMGNQIKSNPYDKHLKQIFF